MPAAALLNDLLLHQFEAALCTLHLAVARCPDDVWPRAVAAWTFDQAAFHATFFADVYLQPGDDVEALKRQPFHLAHAAEFRDYEETEDRAQVLRYDKPFVLDYLRFVRRKANDVICGESAETLAGPSGFRRRQCTRAELHVYNVRHVQHHAAQLILRLRQDSDVDVPWVGHGWKDD